MEVSPFPYHGPLEPGQVHTRQDLLSDLLLRVTEHRPTVLLGPRRYGKTSILRKMADVLIHSGSTIVWVDLFEISSMSDLASRLDQGLSRVPGQAGRSMAKYAAGIDLNLGLVRVQLRGKNGPDDATLIVHDLCETLTRAASNGPITVIFDEFASITNVKGAAGLLRTHLQPHYAKMGLVFAGSEPSMMKALFSDEQQPFYSQADLVTIDPLTTSEVSEVVSLGFDSTNRSPGPLTGRIASFAAGHPQRTMQLSDAAWRLTEAGTSADEDTWSSALELIRASTASAQERLFSLFTRGEKGVLRLGAAGDSIFGRPAQSIGLSAGSAQHARQSLADRGHIRRTPDGLELVDPVFADWIRNRFGT